ncbi:IS110 family transposase [Elioraea sp.]|uniref:IS110 family transposase n=1 Tax=Elioraea sp. TaxID=2185103 RepID=UPI0025C257A5|nr:IS110 family transposase [Elioraea sp.]
MPTVKETIEPSISTDLASEPIFVSVEMSRSKWVVGVHAPDSDKIGIHTFDWGDAAGLLALIERARSRFSERLGVTPRVLCCYEAGYEGFWLHRVLTAAGHRSLVIDPASLLVNRRAKRAKTDRIDARAMVRALMAFERGEDQVLSAVHIPTVEQDDQRRLMRERQRLVKERTAHSNRIKGLLMTQGIVGFDPRAGDSVQQLDQLRTGDGRALAPRLKEELSRELVRLRLVMEQLTAVEAERDAVARAASDEACASAVAITDRDAAMIAALSRIRGVGTNDASVLVREAFWRGFRNRREIAAWSGFAPTPWSSGPTSRDQGITKAGPANIRAHMIQITWRWLQWQPDSRLSQWFQERTQGAMGRLRRIMVVALARKLLVSLWRYATTGLVPVGARVA